MCRIADRSVHHPECPLVTRSRRTQVQDAERLATQDFPFRLSNPPGALQLKSEAQLFLRFDDREEHDADADQ